MTIPFAFTDAEVRAYGEGEPLLRDDVLSRTAVTGIVALLDGMDHDGDFHSAKVGQHRQHLPTVRGDRTAWGTAALLPDLHTPFAALQQALNTDAWLGLGSFTVQLAIYDTPGARYASHRDALRGDPARRATAILYLNSNWIPSHGGCLRIHPPSGSRDVEPISGRLVIFRSDHLLHEVLPSFATRRAATAWFRGRASNPLSNLAQD
jgi:SM-20-related protein